ncbi:MAG TPA: hypothetical protein VFS99_07865 [Xanthomonadaceae bacterium]|nr:hypothetical protein [Xanthomonadaceae bacterium]
MNANNVLGFVRKTRWALGAAVLFSVGIVNAQGVFDVQGAVYQDIEVRTPEGEVETKRVPVARVVPGNEVIYEITYANQGDAPITEVAIDNPVPPQLTFVDVEGVPFTAVSVDGGEAYGALEALTVTAEDGGTRPAQAADVTHLRWVLGVIDPGAGGKVAFKARVK